MVVAAAVVPPGVVGTADDRPVSRCCDTMAADMGFVVSMMVFSGCGRRCCGTRNGGCDSGCKSVGSGSGG